jgi:hypothetical protein
MNFFFSSNFPFNKIFLVVLRFLSNYNANAFKSNASAIDLITFFFKGILYIKFNPINNGSKIADVNMQLLQLGILFYLFYILVYFDLTLFNLLHII